MDYKWYNGTEQQCLDYDAHVTEKEGYKKGDNWADVFEIEGGFYVLKHEKYNAEMDIVNTLPDIKQPEIE